MMKNSFCVVLYIGCLALFLCSIFFNWPTEWRWILFGGAFFWRHEGQISMLEEKMDDQLMRIKKLEIKL